MIALAVAPVQVRTSVELLRFQPQSIRTTQLFTALLAAAKRAGVDVTVTDTYQGRSDWLLLWGAGSPLRWPAMTAHLARGGHLITFDLAYWARYEKFRVSIDGPHPEAWVMRQDWPNNRLKADRVQTGTLWDPAGPVLVAGLGDKARVQYGAAIVDAWEHGMMVECRARGWTVQYRAKHSTAVPIERALQGKSLVVTWHSNVAVDAIRMGVPVVCVHGAAAAVCPSELPPSGPVPPLAAALRDRFLANLAWFQWAPSEAGACWAFLREVLA